MTTHGHTRGGPDPSYRTWTRMMTRCYDKNSDRYPFYGGRGIKICSAWLKFENFYKDMGDRPEGMSLDRIDCNADYSKENCKWSTRKEQANNRRSSRYLEYNGKKLTISQWGDETDIDQQKIHHRIFRLKWSIEKALTTIKNKKCSV